VADERRYALLSRRLQASCIDLVVAFHTPLAVICLVAWLGGPLAGPLAALVALTPLLLEPILVWRTGATVGHRLFGLRVVDVTTGRPPTLLTSVVRYAAKGACLGPWLSPVIALTPRHQGIHDQMCGTVVEVVDPSSRKGRLATYDRALEARTATLGARLLSTVGYAVAISGAAVIVLMAKAVACEPDGCGRPGVLVETATERLWFVLLYLVLWLGPSGRLPGAR
jgi:uncharacterized RDD family membrane protein YckC